MRPDSFDVIIVGARIAGAALAIELAKAGKRVALLDRSTFPADTLSTHFLNPRGMSYLRALGVFDEIAAQTPMFRHLEVAVDEFTLGGQVDEAALGARLKSVHPEREMTIETRYACIRRTILDDVLQQKAVSHGATFMTRSSVEDLIVKDGRAVGIMALHEGRQIALHAQVVVGADGRKSRVAQLAKAEKFEEKKACTFACYTYFSGLELPHGILKRKNRIAFAAVPTNDGLTMVLVYGPARFFPEFRQARGANFAKALQIIDPAFAQLLQTRGRQEEGFYATDKQAAFMRKPSLLGVPLIGDAALFKDQCTASGMMYALRDAILLGDHLVPLLDGRKARNEQLRDFEERRYLDSHRYYDFTCAQAEMNPLRADEREIYEAVAESQVERDRFVGLYFDVVSVKDFFSSRNQERLQKTLAGRPRVQRPASDLLAIYANPFAERAAGSAELAYEQTCLDFTNAPGRSFADRVKPYHQFYRRRQEQNAYQYARTLHAFPGSRTELSDERGRRIRGINFASQDYLGLGQDAEIREAALAALDKYGPHSAGSPMIIGNTLLTHELEAEIGALTGKKYVLLFATGYAAGMGSMTGLVRQHDHVVLDRLAHACLQAGANAATRKIHRFAHLDHASARAILKSIREKDARNAILLVTEGLFSMDADSPDLSAFQDIAHEFDATLFVDVAHDLGASGPGGTGQIGKQGMLGRIDLVMGSFSKAFASNGGFLATDSEAIVQYLKMYSTPHMFSNALSPVQTAVALRAARIVRSAKGDLLRRKLDGVVAVLRREFANRQMTCLGNPSSIVPVVIGSEREARICHRLSTERNIANMILEYPVVALGATRFRLQAMASHTHEDASEAAQVISDIILEARGNTRPAPAELASFPQRH